MLRTLGGCSRVDADGIFSRRPPLLIGCRFICRRTQRPRQCASCLEEPTGTTPTIAPSHQLPENLSPQTIGSFGFRGDNDRGKKLSHQRSEEAKHRQLELQVNLVAKQNALGTSRENIREMENWPTEIEQGMAEDEAEYGELYVLLGIEGGQDLTPDFIRQVIALGQAELEKAESQPEIKLPTPEEAFGTVVTELMELIDSKKAEQMVKNMVANQIHLLDPAYQESIPAIFSDGRKALQDALINLTRNHPETKRLMDDYLVRLKAEAEAKIGTTTDSESDWLKSHLAWIDRMRSELGRSP
ncbi:MAG: hypothetical protein M2R46_04865 [Verrucomicrobia subdivision 3 bacterium]|nr:hypothetical protein [Limisphaerales bacterium]